MHDVKFSIPERELGKADIEFKIKSDKKLIGTLRISKGAIVWIPKDKGYGRKIGWAKFDELMQSQRRKEKR